MKKVLIVFSGMHLPYSPTTLNIFESLRKDGFDVTLLADEPSQQFSSQRLDDPNIHYVANKVAGKDIFSRLRRALVNSIRGQSVTKKENLFTPKALSYISAIDKIDADIIIAVDFFCLWCVQQLQRPAHLVSLEILESDRYYNACDLSKIKSVMIQSEERYQYLFKSIKLPLSILPNSPFYDNFTPDYKSRARTNLIFCGSAIAEFGIFNCLDFLMDFPEYMLTVKGAVPTDTKQSIDEFYNELIAEGRLVLNDTYMSAEELNRYISTFWVGFAFYDFYRFKSLRRFNYYTAPSGKLYQYFNAGVPVIGNQLSGFEIVNKGNAGKLIGCLSSMSIKKALDAIDNSYLEMAANSKKISKDFDLRKFMDYTIDQLKKIQ